METLNQQFVTTVLEEMRRKDLSVAALAKQAGVNRPHLSRWLRGLVNDVGLSFVEKVLGALEVFPVIKIRVVRK